MYEHARQLEAIVGTPSPQKRQQNGLHLNLKTLIIGLCSCQRTYHAEHTSSCPITKAVKEHRALSVLGWETAWEHGYVAVGTNLFIFFCKN